MGAATTSGELMSGGLMQCRHSKVGNLDVAVRTKENVFGFQVPVADFQVVAIRHGAHDLAENTHTVDFCEGPIACDVVI